MINVCFVCLGNICRSPTAEGVFTKLVRDAGLAHEIVIDSAGTGDFHVGEPADRRARAHARARGYALDSVARQFTAPDFARFDHAVAMDASNLSFLRALTRGHTTRATLTLLRAFDPEGRDSDVPDPYYGGDAGFEEVIDICERSCAGLLAHLRALHDL